MVATAADVAVKAFVQLMNPQAVRVVLPDLLAALDTKKNWQTKIAALQAFSELCKRAPLQTNVCLPDIIPAVTSIMGDAKPQVKVWHSACATVAAYCQSLCTRRCYAAHIITEACVFLQLNVCSEASCICHDWCLGARATS